MRTMQEKVESKLKFYQEYRKTQKGNNNHTRKLDAEIELLKELLEDE